MRDTRSQRAERRYRAVDPDNRLVARGLESGVGTEPCRQLARLPKTALAEREHAKATLRSRAK